MHQEEDHLATIPEAIVEWRYVVGSFSQYVNSKYLLSHYDTWELNPCYTGPYQPHPSGCDGITWYDDETGLLWLSIPMHDATFPEPPDTFYPVPF